METIMRKYGFRDWDAVLAAIGHGGLKEGQIVNKMLEYYQKDHQAALTDEDILASLANATASGAYKGKSDKKKNSTTIIGTKLSTLPTPLKIPSITNA